MFPLGSVLFPFMPLQLRVFEERYLVMLGRMLDAETPEFGVVLIERGQEVGGGEHRFSSGTVATILQLSTEGEFVVLALGGRRFEVAEWLGEDPYPQASLRDLPPLEWSDDLSSRLDEAETVVRRSLGVAAEYGDDAWPADVEISDEPEEAAWQLAAIAPLGPLDQMTLLRSQSFAELLDGVIRLTGEAEESLRAVWPEE
jgi:Lon protease-like protein